MSDLHETESAAAVPGETAAVAVPGETGVVDQVDFVELLNVVNKIRSDVQGAIEEIATLRKSIDALSATPTMSQNAMPVLPLDHRACSSYYSHKKHLTEEIKDIIRQKMTDSIAQTPDKELFAESFGFSKFAEKRNQTVESWFGDFKKIAHGSADSETHEAAPEA